MKAVILAGGRGSRLEPLGLGVPKPLAPVCGKPVLLRQLEALRAEGISEAVIVTGCRAEEIETAVSGWAIAGLGVSFFRETSPMGTAGALYRLGLREDFLLLNGDLVFDFELAAMRVFHERSGALATLFVHPNDHPADSTLVETDRSGRVLGFLPKEGRPDACANLCNAGIQILSPALFRADAPPANADLDRGVLRPLVPTGRLYAYKSYEYVKDMGTPERLAEAVADLRRELPARRRRTRPQRAVFLDRDGTLNVHKGFLARAEALELLPGAGEAVRTINRLGFLAVVVTNQPVVARGECTPEELDRIHRRLETLLGEKGAYLDGIYVCPHHPEGGFPGEAPALKRECDCRKPKPGLILRAARELNIDVSASYMAGDTQRDVQAALNAGCSPALLSAGPADGSEPRFPDLAAFAEALERAEARGETL